MSPKIWTLIAGASLGLLVSASACTVTSSDDGGDNDDGGASAGVGGNGTGGSTTSTGGTGGTGVGGGGTCVGCNDYLYPGSELGTICGDDGTGSCEPGTSCELLVDLFTCACSADSANGGCADVCQVGGMDLCSDPPYVPPSTGMGECQECLKTNCSEAHGACTLDI